MMKTESLQYTEHDESYRITVKYGLDYDFAKKNNQAPHFSLTADINRLFLEGEPDSMGDERFPGRVDVALCTSAGGQQVPGGVMESGKKKNPESCTSTRIGARLCAPERNL